MAISTNGVAGLLVSLGVALVATVGAQEQPPVAPPASPPAAPAAAEEKTPVTLDSLAARIASLEARLDELTTTKSYERRILTDGDWQEVVPNVQPGEVLDIVATGTWNVSPNFEAIGADGATGGALNYNKFPPNRHGALVATFETIVNSNPNKVKSAVAVGAKASLTVPAEYSGPLMLRMNDTDVGNNSGALFVTVTVHRKAAK